MPVDLHDPIRQSGSNLCVCGATVDDPVHPTGVARGVRTHSVGRVGGVYRTPKWVCRGCGARWDIDAVPLDVERLPCGTRAPDPGSEES